MDSPFSKPVSTVINELDTNKLHGLTAKQARVRLGLHGYNRLRRASQTTGWQIIARQLNNPLGWILILAGILALSRGENSDAVIVLVVVVVNVLVGALMEYRSERIAAKLHSILANQSTVIRDGQEETILSTHITVGDIVALEAGERVPADLRIIESRNLRVNQATLTGEAVPVEKADGVLGPNQPLAERSNMLYAPSIVISGRAVAVVTATGMSTELGQIAKEVHELDEPPSTLTQEINRLSRYILIASAVLSAILVAAGLMSGMSGVMIIGVAVSLLVSLIPEGLPIALTAVLSLAATRVFKAKSLIRQLSASETLGEVTTICLDKTGTISEGVLTVERLITSAGEYDVTGHGYRLSGNFYATDKRVDVAKHPVLRTVLELSSLATMSTITKNDLVRDETRSLIDPTETALAVVAAKAGFYAFQEEKRFPELLEIPFDDTLRYSTSVHKYGKINRYIVKGAAEKILNLSTHVLSENGKPLRLLQETHSHFDQQINHFASQGYRMVAIGYVDQPSVEPLNPHKIKNLTFAGILCLTDPLKLDASTAVSRAKQLGLRLIMITGDHLLTAQAVAQRIGLLDNGRAIHAQDLRSANLKDVTVIARATPTDKLVLVERLQHHGEVVAMTGDGVNDAPALKKADIGIAMGRNGTDIAVEAADMILLDDGLNSITYAITQGRLIRDNIRKIIFYLISTTLAEGLVVILVLFLGLPLLLLPAQILWMNLITDGVTSLSLTNEPAEKHIARRHKEPLITLADARRWLLLSLVMTVGTVFVYEHYLPTGLELARTAALLTMTLFQLFNLFNARSATKSIFKLPRAKFLLWSLFLLALALQGLAIYTNVGNQLLHTAPLPLSALLIAAIVPLSIIIVDELRKWIVRLAFDWAQAQNLATT